MKGKISKRGSEYWLTYSLDAWFSDWIDRRKQQIATELVIGSSEYLGVRLLLDAEEPGDVARSINFVFSDEKAAQFADTIFTDFA